MNKFFAVVRVNGSHVKIAVFADSVLHAQILLQYYFGMNSIVISPTLARSKDTNEDYKTLEEAKGFIKPIKPLDLQQARLASLKTQKDNASKALKIERNRQKIRKAQQTINKAIYSKP